MVKPCGASFLEVILLTTYHLPLNHLIGFANGQRLKLVMLSREKRGSVLLTLLCTVKMRNTRLWFLNAVMDLQVTQHVHKITK